MSQFLRKHRACFRVLVEVLLSPGVIVRHGFVIFWHQTVDAMWDRESERIYALQHEHPFSFRIAKLLRSCDILVYKKPGCYYCTVNNNHQPESEQNSRKCSRRNLPGTCLEVKHLKPSFTRYRRLICLRFRGWCIPVSGMTSSLATITNAFPYPCTTLIRVMATNSYGTVQSSAPTSDSELCDVQLQNGQPTSHQDEGLIVGNGRQGSSTEELNELKDFSSNAGSIINQKANSIVVIVLYSIYYAPSLHTPSPPMYSGMTSVSQLVTIQDML
ncbi:hypothetical protein EDD85DRAFT_794612 [Armillaria nabsnona]|nr:hypothetical protein EDD85DRAFT_794612 [Armillaria nabsnona]